jgi:hypothetical protein
MTAPTTSATPKIALDQRATSRHDNAIARSVAGSVTTPQGALDTTSPGRIDLRPVAVRPIGINEGRS